MPAEMQWLNTCFTLLGVRVEQVNWRCSKKLHAACRMNSLLISICAATSLAALLYEGATMAHLLFSYPVEDETDVDDQDLATCDFKQERSDFLFEVLVIF